MKKKIKKNILKIFISIFVIIYIVFGNDYLDNIDASIKEVSKEISNINDKDIKNGNILSVYFIDVGQADCILIKENDKNMLIDAGNNEDGEKLVTYFKGLNIDKFDYVIATHAHEDHIGGMDDIINNFEVTNFYMPDVLTTTKTFEDLLNALLNNNIKYDTFDIDEEFDFGNSYVNVIYVGDDSNDLNDTSIVMKLTYGNNSFLFTGDMTSKVEKKVLNKNIQSDVLKVAHHGSNYSSTNNFLSLVNPKYAVISVGKNNSYNHPSKSTLNSLNNKNIKVYRTDINGTIIVNSDGNNLDFKTVITDTNG